MVKFLNTVPWGGLGFYCAPNSIIELPEETAKIREAAGLGKLVIDKSKKAEIEPAKAAEPKKAKAQTKAEIMVKAQSLKAE